MDSNFIPDGVCNDSQNHLLSRKNGETLSVTAIAELKDTAKCNIIVKGQASTDKYQAAIDRWNRNGIKEAVRHFSLWGTEVVLIICV
jgi:hypothetical protein